MCKTINVYLWDHDLLSKKESWRRFCWKLHSKTTVGRFGKQSGRKTKGSSSIGHLREMVNPTLSYPTPNQPSPTSLLPYPTQTLSYPTLHQPYIIPYPNLTPSVHWLGTIKVTTEVTVSLSLASGALKARRDRHLVLHSAHRGPGSNPGLQGLWIWIPTLKPLSNIPRCILLKTS